MATLRQPGVLGRFRLLRELGRGAQATVWLAHDPRLDREVALKLLDPAADSLAVSQWLHEARAVSRLKHPNIVPVFEADEQDGQPYLVFEYVQGPTLAQSRRGKPPMPPREAAALLLGVLEALVAAHDEGIVHRDLKPSNILLGADGRPRVMDFGIAARVAPLASSRGPGRADPVFDAAEGLVVGTPGYISPEAARAEAPVPAMDVFASGVLLAELLSGAPLLRERDSQRAIELVQHTDLALPAGVQVDGVLRGIVQRALARDVAARYDNARSMHAALQAWARPAEVVAVEPVDKHATLTFLLRRMRHKTDFPALSASVVRIQRVATSETESLASLSEEILKDVALTNKLLRMVNTAQFTAVAGGGISTVSRAVALVGFAGIRNMALSLVLLEHMNDKGHAAQLKDEFLRALMAGTLADAFSLVPREAEEAFLAAMFQNLGRLLSEFYFPEEALQIRQRLVDPEPTQAAREIASRQVLGISFDDLGAGVARAWGLPDTLQRGLRHPAGEAPTRALARGPERVAERLRWLGRSANAMADAWLLSDPEARSAAVEAAAASYAPVLEMSPAQVTAAAQRARIQVGQLASAMGLDGSCLDAPARSRVEPRAVARAVPTAGRIAQTVGIADAATFRIDAAGPAGQRLLAQALSEVLNPSQGRSLPLKDLLNLVLESMYRAMEFRCLVFCLREPGSGRLVGRIGLGAFGAETSAAFRIAPDLAAVGDLFAVLCAKGADLMVANSAAVRKRLPAWYVERVNAPTFLLLPLVLDSKPLGLIYADKASAGAIAPSPEELGLLRSLRDLVTAALAKRG